MSGIRSSMSFPTLPKSPELQQAESGPLSITSPLFTRQDQAAFRSGDPPSLIAAAAATVAVSPPPPYRHSDASTRSSVMQDSAPSSSTASTPTSTTGGPIGFPTIARPTSRASLPSSRPSSVASNSSSGASSYVHGQLAVCPGILSPGLASALGLTPSTSAGGSGSSAGRRDSTGSNHQQHHHHRRIRAQSTQGPTSTIRRPSLPLVPSMAHRMSVASVSSFESLPEDEIVHGFNMSSGPGCLPKARHSSYERLNPAAASVSAAGKQLAPSSAPASASSLSDAAARAAIPSSSQSATSPSKLSHQLEASCSLHSRDESTSSATSTSSSGSAISTRPTGLLKRSATVPSQNADLIQMLAHRRNAAMELLESEKSFMSSLELLDEEYYKPLMASLGRSTHGGGSASPLTSAPAAFAASATPILDRKAVGEIFSNFSDILHLTKELLSRLEGRLRNNGGSTTSSSSRGGTQAAKGSQASAGPEADAAAGAKGRPWDPALDTVGDILVPLAPFMKMYSLFVKNFSGALQRIEVERKSNEAFALFLRETEQRRLAREMLDSAATGKKAFGFGLGFQAHLLTIVQRIPRYKLLFDDLIRHTPESHVDRSDLVRAGTTIEQVASYINENVRQHEMVLMMLSLQRSLQGLTEPLVVPGRSLIRRGTLMKTCRRNVQPREFFLFTDCIIYASPISGGIESASAAWLALAQKGGLYGGAGAGAASAATAASDASAPRTPASPGDASAAIETILPRARLRTISGPEAYTPLAGVIFSLAGHQLQYRGKFPLRDCTVVSVDDHSLHGLRYCFEIRTPDKSFAVYAETSASKGAWVAAIREARADHMSARRTLRADEDSIEARRDKRRSSHHQHHRIDLPPAAAASNRRLSTQSLGQYIGLASASTSIPEVESEMADVDGGTDAGGRGDLSAAAVAAARTRTESAPNIFRPPSFPGFPSNAKTMSLATLLSPSAHATPTKPLRVLDDYNAPVWVPDNRAERCACCSEVFGMWRRKHHCRLCGQVVCWTCSQRSFLIPAYQDGEDDRPARACDSCYDSVFPAPDSPEGSPATSALPPSALVGTATLNRSSVNMAAGVSNDGSASGMSVSSSGLFDSDTSHGSPATPGGSDIGPHFGQHLGPSPLASPPSSATLRPELVPTAGQDKGGGGRPKSLRFDSLPQPAFTPAAAAEADRRYSSSPPKIPTRSRSIGGARGGGGMAAPLMPEGRSSAVEAQLFHAALHPQVQAATSGSGTFRLVTPRLTTPDDSELPPNQFGGRRSSHTPSLLGGGGGGMSSYFGIVDGEAGGAGAVGASASASSMSTAGGLEMGSSSESFKPSMIHGANGIPAHLRPQKKRPMSAADRLSTFYGANIGMLGSGGGGSANGDVSRKK